MITWQSHDSHVSHCLLGVHWGHRENFDQRFLLVSLANTRLKKKNKKKFFDLSGEGGITRIFKRKGQEVGNNGHLNLKGTFWDFGRGRGIDTSTIILKKVLN